MKNILKHSSYFSERFLTNNEFKKNPDLELYWSKFFQNNRRTFEEALASTSNIPLQDLNNYFHGDFSFEIDNKYIDFAEKYFNKIDEELSLEKANSILSDYSLPFSTFFTPFIALAISELKDKNIMYKEFLENPICALIEKLFQISHKVLILEINVSRVLNANEELNTEERYKIFVQEKLKDKSYLKNLFNEYPVLFRLLLHSINEWVEYISEIIENTLQNKSDLQRVFNNGNELGEIKEIKFGLGDFHNGKCVASIEFNCGKICIYKPRSLAIDKEYNELVKFFNAEKTTKYPFFEMKIFEKNHYGWTEFIEHLGCTNESKIKEFYVRSGNLLGLLYILNATDFHHENIIAHSEYPVPIDLESLLHQDVFEFNENGTDKRAVEKANILIKNSVHSIGMLPHQIFLEKGKKKGIDLSGMSVKSEKLSSYKIQKITNLNSDFIKIDQDFYRITPEKNNPYINEKELKNSNYLKEIEYGFCEFYKWAMNHKDTLKERLEIFSNLESRFIIRATNQYSRLLTQSFHPDLLRNGLARDLFLHRVNINKPQKKDINKVIRKEKNDLLNSNIPYFFTKANETNLYIDEFNKINQYFQKSVMEIIQTKINKLSEEDLSLQLNIIDMSIIAGDYEYLHENVNSNSLKINNSLLSKNDYLYQAIEIGEYILSKSIKGTINGLDDCCWISTVFNGSEDNDWSIGPTGVDLYNGNAGIAIFFAYLSKLTNRDVFKKASYTALNSIRETLKNNLSDFENLGAFDGWTGGLYSMYIVADCWNDRELAGEVHNGIDLINNKLESIEENDVISGLAGILGILLSIYQTKGYTNALRGAEICANKIVNNVIANKNSNYWQSPHDKIAYTGFAHGSSGIIAMLARLYAINKNPQLLDVIRKGLAFERNHYDSSENNWKRSSTEDTIQYSWCHGAPGILLNRLILKNIGYQDHLIDGEIEIAINTVLKKGVVSNHSLCHGNFGQIEILKMACQLTKNAQLAPQIKNMLDYVLHDIRIKGLENLNIKKETQGLMNGLAGYGYGLLSQSTAIKLPSMLMLGPV